MAMRRGLRSRAADNQGAEELSWQFTSSAGKFAPIKECSCHTLLKASCLAIYLMAVVASFAI